MSSRERATLTSSINGIATDGWTAEATVDYLQNLFHRPITGVLNKTLGMWFDLIECILQRDLFWTTQDIRSGYEVGDSH